MQFVRHVHSIILKNWNRLDYIRYEKLRKIKN